MNSTSKIVISSILTILLVTLSSGSYSVNQVNSQGTGEQGEQASQEAMEKQDCMQIKDKMATYVNAAVQYASKKCDELLK